MNALGVDLGTGLDALATRAFAILLESSVKAAFLLALAGLASFLLRRRSPALRHLAWSTGLAGALAMPVLVALVPSWSLPVALPLPELGVSRVAEGSLATRADIPAASELAAAGAGALFASSPGALASSSTPAAAARGGSSAFAVAGLAKACLAAWALGALALLLHAALACRRARALVRAGRELVGDTQLPELAAALDLSRPVRLVESSEVSVPLACGTLRPALVVPVGFSEWDPERRRVVLLHELAHVKRNDCLAQLVGRGATAVHWFNPLAWFAQSQLRHEAEHAADDQVLAAGTRASDYAGHLLAVVRSLTPERPAVGLSMAGSPVERRLISILDPARQPRRPSRRLTALAALAAAPFIASLGTLSLTAGAEGVSELHQAPAPALACSQHPRPAAAPAAAPAPALRSAPAVLPAPAAGPAPALRAAPLAPPARLAPRSALVNQHDDHDHSVLEHLKRKIKDHFHDGTFDTAMRRHEEGNYQASAEGFARAHAEGEREAVAAYNAACAHARLGQTDQAIAWLEVALDEGFSMFELLETDDDLASLRKDRRFQRIVEEQRQLVRERKERGDKSARDPRAEARAELEELNAAASSDGKAWYRVGMRLHELGEHDQAISCWEKSLELGARVGDSAYNIACAQARSGRTKKALAAFDRAVELGYSDARHARDDDDLETLRAEPRFVAALGLLDRLEMPSTGWGPFGDSSRSSSWKEASERFEAVLEERPKLGRAWFNLGFASLQLDDPGRALAAFRTAHDLGYRQPVSAYNIGCSYARLNQPDDAFAWLDRAAAAGFLDPSQLADDEDLKNLRGDPRFEALHRSMKDRLEARKASKKPPWKVRTQRDKDPAARERESLRVY